MEACERISLIFYMLLALIAWNLDIISSSPLLWQPLAPVRCDSARKLLDEFRLFSSCWLSRVLGAWLHWRGGGDFVVLAVAGAWRLGGGGAGLAAFLLRFVLFFFVMVVDVPVVQVVDVGVQFLDTFVDLPVVVQVVGLWSRQCSPWSSAVAVLGQGGDMPVVSTTGAWRCRRCSSCGCGRPCDYAATSGLANSGDASSRRLRTFQLCNRDGYSFQQLGCRLWRLWRR